MIQNLDNAKGYTLMKSDIAMRFGRHHLFENQSGSVLEIPLLSLKKNLDSIYQNKKLSEEEAVAEALKPGSIQFARYKRSVNSIVEKHNKKFAFNTTTANGYESKLPITAQIAPYILQNLTPIIDYTDYAQPTSLRPGTDHVVPVSTFKSDLDLGIDSNTTVLKNVSHQLAFFTNSLRYFGIEVSENIISQFRREAVGMQASDLAEYVNDAIRALSVVTDRFFFTGIYNNSALPNAGLFNMDGIVNNSILTKAINTMTTQEIVDFFTKLSKLYYDSTNGMISPTTLVLRPEDYTHLATTPISNDGTGNPFVVAKPNMTNQLELVESVLANGASAYPFASVSKGAPVEVRTIPKQYGGISGVKQCALYNKTNQCISFGIGMEPSPLSTVANDSTTQNAGFMKSLPVISAITPIKSVRAESVVYCVIGS